MSTKSCAWNWVSDDKTPHAYLMKYQAEKLIQPNDSIKLPAHEFITTGRDYPVFRYAKSVTRNLDVDGAIKNGEADANCTKADAEKLATANHTVYRQPDGKWYQSAIQNVTFGREMGYTTIKIQQEAESR